MTDYFVRRQPPRPPDFEESYWGTVLDPDGLTRHRLDERELFLEDARQELASLDGLRPGRILDVGCGPGFLLSGLARAWEKHGVEVSRVAAEHARRWATVFEGNLTDARYPVEHFDVVVLYHVIEHLDDPIATILEARRILKSQGVLLLGTPDFDSACARRFGARYRLLNDPTHIRLFTNDSMHRFLRDHGFVIDRVECPFFETRHFTRDNLERLFDTTKVSPPFAGNFMTFYCHKPDHDESAHILADERDRLAKLASLLQP